MRKRIRLYLLKPQFRDDICDCAGESWPASKFRISAEPASLSQFMNGAVCDRLNAQCTKWNCPLRSQ